MLIQYSVEGGIAYFPGLARPKILDTTDLTNEAATKLHQLISEINFLKLPAEVGTARKGSGDMRIHSITIEEVKHSHTVRIIEPVDDPRLKNLLDTIEQSIKSSKK